MKFITEDSNAIHTIITSRLLKLNELIIQKLLKPKKEAPSKVGLGLE